MNRRRVIITLPQDGTASAEDRDKGEYFEIPIPGTDRVLIIPKEIPAPVPCIGRSIKPRKGVRQSE
jgi:hypothetical protein